MLDLNFVCQNSSYTDNLNLTLSMERPGVNAAPSPVWFECSEVVGAAAAAAIAIYDPQYHEILYMWDFGDAANATPTTDLNLPTAWKNTNTGYGRRVAHVFNDPGTYTVTCYAYEPSTRRFGTQTFEVTIADPDTVFPGGQTIIYDPNMTADVSAYPGATVVTTRAALEAARSAIGAFTNARILLASDVDEVFTDADGPISTNGWANCRIGALDPNGPRPRLRASGRRGGSLSELIRCTYERCAEMALYGINFSGEWDSTTELGPIVSPVLCDKNTALIGSDNHLLMYHQCTFDGWQQVRGHLRLDASMTGYQVFSDSAATNWQNYGLTVGGVAGTIYVAVVGSRLAQHVDALSGGNKNGLYGNHGPLRDFASNHLYISVVDGFSRDGWSIGGTAPDGLSFANSQPFIRVNTSGDPGMSSYIDRCAGEGGGVLYTEQDSSETDVPGNHVCDSLILAITPQQAGRQPIEITFGGTTIRNCFGFIPAAPAYSITNKLVTFINVSDQDGSPENAAAGVRLHNNTFLDLRDDAQIDTTVTVASFNASHPFDVEEELNSLLHEPNKAAGDTSNAPIDLVTASGVVTRYKGPRWNFLHESGSLSSLADGASFTISYADVKDTRVNVAAEDEGTPTDQAYWLVHAATDTKHEIVFGDDKYHAAFGDFTVSFGASEITITNTSGATWSGTYALRLDRTSRLPIANTAYATDAISVPTARPQSGSSAIGVAVSTLYKDAFGVERPHADVAGWVLEEL